MVVLIYLERYSELVKSHEISSCFPIYLDTPIFLRLKSYKYFWDFAYNNK